MGKEVVEGEKRGSCGVKGEAESGSKGICGGGGREWFRRANGVVVESGVTESGGKGSRRVVVKGVGEWW